MIGKQTIGWLIGVCILFPLFIFLYNKITVRKNDGEKYFSAFLSQIKPVKLTVPAEDSYYLSEDNIGFDHFRRGASAIGFKGLSGNIISVRFREPTINKYLIISVYDVDGQLFYPLSELMYGKQINGWVNREDLSNPKYGTKEKPIPVFNFKGIKEPIRSYGPDATGSNIIYQSLEPTDKQYRHNVLTYLTYVMTKEEFRQRFEGKN
jgi:hypothetical protein